MRGGSRSSATAPRRRRLGSLSVAALLLLVPYRRRRLHVPSPQDRPGRGESERNDGRRRRTRRRELRRNQRRDRPETNKEDQDVEKAPLRPTAYPGGQSLPPWPYPEAKPTARPTPASYDPACILKVSWPRGAARPTEFALRETFQALAPVLNVGLGSGNAAMVVFKDAAGARAAEAGIRRAVADRARQAPAAAADQPPPPPKTGDV